MNFCLVIAAILTFVVGLVHSILGERLIFSRLRQGGLVPTNGGSLLQERHVRILWASWHLVTVFGWVIAAVLLWLSLPSSNQSLARYIENVVIIAMLAGSALVFFGTKARHTGWVGLLAVAAFVWLGFIN